MRALAMEPFIKSTYEINSLNGRRACAPMLFKSEGEILDHIKNLPVGVYHVFLALPSDTDGTRNSEWWREVEKHDDGSVTCSVIAREMDYVDGWHSRRGRSASLRPDFDGAGSKQEHPSTTS
jgi:hypothetical protein